MKLETTKERVLEAAGKCKEAKETLKTLFPEVFKSERVETFKEACETNGVSVEDIVMYPNPKNKQQRSSNGYNKLVQIRIALNRPGYEPNYADSNEAKWKCIWEYKAGSGFVFYYSHAFYYYAAAFGGPLLDCETQEIADYFATQFPAEWKEYLEG